MTQRYKIIAQKEGVKITHYELWFECRFLWLKRWVSVVDEGEAHTWGIPKKFSDLNEVRKYIQRMNTSREIVEEGIIE